MKFVLVLILAAVATIVAAQPKVTNKVFFDIEIGGEAAG